MGGWGGENKLKIFKKMGGWMDLVEFPLAAPVVLHSTRNQTKPLLFATDT